MGKAGHRSQATAGRGRRAQERKPGNRRSGSDGSGHPSRRRSDGAVRSSGTEALVRILFVPDTHVPHESEEAWGVLLAAAKKLKPHVIVVLGDFADVESLSAHDKPNGRRVFLAEELPLVRARLRELEGLGAGELIYVMGNHEYRLERYIAKHAPELDGITSWDALLGLGKWKVVPYNESYRIGKLWLTHTTGEAGDNAHRAAARTFMGSAMIGHTHRMGYEVRGKMGGAPYLAAMLGWLGDPAKAKYMHDAKAATHWVNGFGVGYMEPATGIVHVHPVPIIKGRACFNGEIIGPVP